MSPSLLTRYKAAVAEYRASHPDMPEMQLFGPCSGCDRIIPVSSVLPEWCEDCCSDTERAALECNSGHAPPLLILIPGGRA